MRYQYSIEVVNVIPADTLTSTGGGPRRKLQLRCVRRDAVFECTEVPTSFEVRSAPGYDYLECALVAQDGEESVVARTHTPLVIGGPHRTVGAVWVCLAAPSNNRSSGSVSAAAGTAGNASPSTPRVFVAWAMANADGSPVCASELKEPLSPSVSQGRNTDTLMAVPSSVLLPSGRLSLAAVAAGSLSDDLHYGGQASAARAADAPELPTPHVSIVLDEAQEAAAAGEQLDASRSSSGARRTAVEAVKATECPREAQAVILSRFPRCSVSSSCSLAPEEEGVDGGTAATTAAATETKGRAVVADAAVPPPPSQSANLVDLFATSTQRIGSVPWERRHHNLHLVPCPLLLDQLATEVRGAATAATDKRATTSTELWRVAHRHPAITSQLGSATSALESLRREHETRANPGTFLPRAAGEESDHVRREIGGESALKVLRLGAMAAIRQRRVTYTT